MRVLIDSMTGCMMHERFYGSGTYVDEDLGLGVGSIFHKGSFADCTPVWNESRDICLVFSGEAFGNEPEIERLRRDGLEFNFESASYLVHLYEKLGPRFLESLNGWFSGVVVDLREQRVILFNDRYGFDRVYYHEGAGVLYFASEAKSLLKILPELRQLDFSSLGESVSLGTVLKNRTLFSGISLLPGGAMWTFSRGRPVKKEAYFAKSRWESQPLLDSGGYYEKLRETFSRILPKYLRGKIAMSLTGGLDGRMIMAWASAGAGTLPCYTFGGSYRECGDVKLARSVAKTCGQHHQVILVDDKFLREFPTLAEKAVYLSDGAMDVTGSVDLYVNRIAREIAPIRLTGNYGSEILRGNVAFKPGFLDESLFEPEFARCIKEAATTYSHEANDRDLSFIAFKQVPWHHYSRLALERTQLTLRSPYLDNELVELQFRAPAILGTSNSHALRLIGDGNPALSRIATDRGLLRRPVPIVTRARNLFQEFTFKAEYAYDYGMPQWLAKLDHIAAPLHLEKVFLGRHKFYHFRVWYRDELTPYLKDILLDSRTRSRPFLRGGRLEQLVDRHISGRGNYTREIHRILTIELLQRQLIEQK
jgi:asparagine synthase (glutamine-hydrolysing)